MHQQIIDKIKAQYPRDVRKQVVKSMLKSEKSNDREDIEFSYTSINQIFSYVIGELQWKIASSSSGWDNTPLSVMSECFPKIETTKWFQDKQLDVKNIKK